jgi:phosphoribosylformylglycinamidine synthase subunit PurL
VLVTGASRRLLRSAHDCAEGGLAVTVAESSFDTGVGADINVTAVVPSTPGFGEIATLFGESASRVVVSVAPAHVDELLSLAKAENVPAVVIGRVGGDRIRVSIEGRLVIDEPLLEAEQIWANAIGRYFERSVA